MVQLGKNAFDNAARCIELGQSTCRWIGNLIVTGTISAEGGADVLSNNTYLQSLNAAGSGTVSLIKADATDNTFVNASTGKLIKFGINSVSLMTFSGTVLAPATASLVALGTLAVPFGTIFSAGLKADASNNTVINAATSKFIGFDINDVSLMTFTGTLLAPVTTGLVDLGSSSLGFGSLHAALAKTLVLKQGSNGKTGTVTLNGTTPVAVGNTSITANSGVVFTLKTVGGTVGAVPSIKTITPSTGFTVAGTASDTSVYNYHVIEAEA